MRFARLVPLLALMGCVCCDGAVPDGMSRASPEQSSQVLQYAIDQEDWDLAYCSLSELTREEYGYLTFRTFFAGIEDQASGEKLVELIRRAHYFETLPNEDGTAVTYHIFDDNQGIAAILWTLSEHGWLMAQKEQAQMGPDPWLELPRPSDGPVEP